MEAGQAASGGAGVFDPTEPSVSSRACSCRMIRPHEPTHSPPPSRPPEPGAPEGREGGEAGGVEERGSG